MRRGPVFVPLAAAALLVAACTSTSHPPARPQPPGGPGPSIIDLPAPGCWTFQLSWSGHTDELKLHYVA